MVEIDESREIGTQQLVFFSAKLKNTQTNNSVCYFDFDFIDMEGIEEKNQDIFTKAIVNKMLSQFNSEFKVIDKDNNQLYLSDIVKVVGQEWIDNLNVFQKLIGS